MANVPWRAFYADETEYVSTETTYEELPREGMVGVVEYEEDPYRKKVHGGDWYWMELGRWHLIPTGAWNTWQPRPVDHAIRSTPRLPEDVYERIRLRMHNARTTP